MPSPGTVADFLCLLHKSGLVEPEALAAHEAGLPDTPAAAAKKLIKLGLITAYHAEHLLAGRCKGFFLGAYRLLGRLGKGGMAAVYLAEHLELKRRVAIKVFPPERVADPTALARFQREGRAAAALDHPNIVRVHDIAHAGNVHFLVMEYVEGVTLDQFVKDKGALPPARVIAFAKQVAAALAHAHGKGIVHRDIKPGNLLLDAAGDVKVLDIGLARITHDSSDDLTRKIDEHAVLGTADYIAPEQAIHSAVDGRADLYSLGATLYALLTGTPPYGGQSFSQKLVSHQLKEARPLAEVRPGVPAALAAIVTRLMAKRPEDRYQTAEALLAALDGKDEPAAPMARRLWPAAAAAAILTLLSAVAGGWLAMASRAPRPEPRVEIPAPQPDAPQPEVPKPDAPKPPVVAAPPPPLYRLDLRNQPFTRKEVKKGTSAELDGPVARRWKVSVWKADATCAFAVEQADGRPALAVRNLQGGGGFFVLRDLPLRTGRRFTAEVTYRLEGGGYSNVRLLEAGQKAADLYRLPAGAGGWATATHVFEVQNEGKTGLEFHVNGTAPNAAVLLRDVVVRDAGPLSDPYPLQTYVWDAAFRTRVKHRETLDQEGETPAGFTLQTWAAESVVEAERVEVSRPALKLTMLEGKGTGMLFLTTPKPVPGRTYTLRVEYRTQGRPSGHVKFRNVSTKAEDVGRLDDSAGWRVATWRVEPPKAEAGVIEVHHGGNSLGDLLWLGKVEWVEDGVVGD